ncbi:glycerol-3-phosphate dehydrogenase/oxidase [Algoriphagus vanfongensis]|uniref:glycerol-3-phosphate dehydrogenase/oxidase n=1 Tax=Algoriphagus vanfongensis TaxID=426371 RepID=UPI000425C264|nr:glycerol-3-phosphate dehydrogenase/oxidase [Algoriphagus vanfongensis]
MNRKENLKQISDSSKIWDIAVIGGGSSGLGVALDAISRGLTVVLLEKADFAKGTSSRSTKLVHGGVRYLAQGDVGLVLEALKERGKLLQNAPHLTQNQAFIIPVYTWMDRITYSAGLKLYDWMAGKLSLGSSSFISKEETVRRMPTVKKDGLKGGIVYHDGQFDDARLALAIAKTADDAGACILNYASVKDLIKSDKGKLLGLKVRDELSGEKYTIHANMVVNATGVFADKILQMDQPGSAKMIQPSQGIHLVLDRKFLGGNDALMIPKTRDGRVLFAVPWQDKLVVGTTDTLREKPKLEPSPLQSEIDFILETAASYLTQAPTREDVLSVFAGLRPLARPKEEGAKTKEISRSHKVIVSPSNLVTLTGGKWTTFRKMGEDTVEYFTQITREIITPSQSMNMLLSGYTKTPPAGHWSVYGAEASKIQQIASSNPLLAEKIHPAYPYIMAEIYWAIHQEMAVKLEDVLARRIRLLFLDAQAAIDCSEKAVKLMAKELNKDEAWASKELEDFQNVAKKYLIKA